MALIKLSYANDLKQRWARLLLYALDVYKMCSTLRSGRSNDATSEVNKYLLGLLILVNTRPHRFCIYPGNLRLLWLVFFESVPLLRPNCKRIINLAPSPPAPVSVPQVRGAPASTSTPASAPAPVCS